MKPLKILAFALCIGFAQNAFAVNSINVQTFNPSTSDRFVFLEDGYKSEWPKKAKMYFGANYNYVTSPLVVLNNAGTARNYNIIDAIQTVDMHLGFKLANNFALFIGAPIHFITFPMSYPAANSIPFPTGNRQAFGDMKVLGKIRLTDDDSHTNIALIPEIHLPTGGTEFFVSDASTYMGARLALERQFTSWTLVANIGYAAASNAFYVDSAFPAGVDYRKRLITGLGGFLPFNEEWGMNVEVNNINMLPFDQNVNPNDAYAGLRYAPEGGVVLTAGGSVGRIGGAQGQEFRFVAGLRYTLFEDAPQAPKPIATGNAGGYSVPATNATPPAPNNGKFTVPQLKKKR